MYQILMNFYFNIIQYIFYLVKVDLSPPFLYYGVMNKLIVKLLVGVVGIGIAVYVLKPNGGVTYDGSFSTILLVGLVTGLLIYFVRPILSLITFPLRLITLNLFSFVIMMFLIWVVDAIFPADMFEIFGLLNLFYVTLIVWGTELLSSLAFK